MIAQIDGFMFV